LPHHSIGPAVSQMPKLSRVRVTFVREEDTLTGL
jgi:hypothetical protein